MNTSAYLTVTKCCPSMLQPMILFSSLNSSAALPMPFSHVSSEIVGSEM